MSAAPIYLIFFGSGLSALVFEALWFRQAGLALGSSVWASSLVLAGFMGGLALGNGLAARFAGQIRNPFRTYAAAEALIAVSGLAIVLWLPELGATMTPWIRPLLDNTLLVNILRFSVAFCVLLVPSTAMGVTLPLLTKTLMAYDAAFGPVLGKLYGWNTLGAMVGAVVGEVYLVEIWGIRGTAVAAGAVNLLAAAVALWLSRSIGRRESGDRLHPSRRSFGSLWKRAASRPWLIAAFFSGFSLLALEVVWFRLLLLFVMGHATAFAVMLAVVLAGIGLGGLLAGQWLRRDTAADRFAAAAAGVAGLTCVTGYAVFPLVIGPFEATQIMKPLQILQVSLPLMFPASLVSGLFFTLVGVGLRRDLSSETATTGMLTLANTTGAAGGSLIGGFVLLPTLGVETALLAVAAIYACIGGLLFLTARTAARWASPILAVLVGGIVLTPFGSIDEHLFDLPLTRYAAQRDWATDSHNTPPTLIGVREGLTETILYLEVPKEGRPLYRAMFMNSVSMADTEFQSRRYMKLYVYLPMAVHPDPKRALLICYGIGNTAKAMTDSDRLHSIDVVDISRDVLETSHEIFPDEDERPLLDPRVRTHVEDGRYFLQTTEARFDLITAEPPPPTSAGIVNLYTREYFELMRDRLAHGGIATYWLPLHALSEVSTKAILRAFCDAFEDCSLWNAIGTQLMMVGTRNARGPVSESQFNRQWLEPGVGDEMRRLGFERPEQLGALFIGDAEYLDALTAGSRPLIDDDPKLVEATVESPAEAEQLIRSFRDVSAARQRFESSPLIARLWPERLRTASLPYFGVQNIINAFGYGAPTVSMDDIHLLLTGSRLRSLARWLLGSDSDVQQLLDSATADELAAPEWQFHLGVRHIAEREYAAAVEPLKRAEASVERRTQAFGLRIYALCMAGRRNEAERLARERDAENLQAQGLTPGSPDAPPLPPFWRWMTRTFDLQLR